MSVLGRGCRLALAVIALLLWTDDPAQEERGASRTYWLNIPSQPLLCLITAFGNFLYEVIIATSRLRREAQR